jgi:hypothetical protein
MSNKVQQIPCRKSHSFLEAAAFVQSMKKTPAARRVGDGAGREAGGLKAGIQSVVSLPLRR